MQKTTIRKVLIFLVSSGATGGIYFGLLYLLGDILKMHPLIAVSVAYGVAMAQYFVTNKLLAFQSTAPGSLRRELLQFIVLALVNYALTLGIVALISKYTKEVYSGSVVAGIVTTTLTYFVFDKLLFKTRGRTDGSAGS